MPTPTAVDALVPWGSGAPDGLNTAAAPEVETPTREGSVPEADSDVVAEADTKLLRVSVPWLDTADVTEDALSPEIDWVSAKDTGETAVGLFTPDEVRVSPSVAVLMAVTAVAPVEPTLAPALNEAAALPDDKPDRVPVASTGERPASPVVEETPAIVVEPPSPVETGAAVAELDTPGRVRESEEIGDASADAVTTPAAPPPAAEIGAPTTREPLAPLGTEPEPGLRPDIAEEPDTPVSVFVL